MLKDRRQDRLSHAGYRIQQSLLVNWLVEQEADTEGLRGLAHLKGLASSFDVAIRWMGVQNVANGSGGLLCTNSTVVVHFPNIDRRKIPREDIPSHCGKGHPLARSGADEPGHDHRLRPDSAGAGSYPRSAGRRIAPLATDCITGRTISGRRGPDSDVRSASRASGDRRHLVMWTSKSPA